MSCRKPCLPLLSVRPGAKTQKRAEAMALLLPGLTLEDVLKGDLAKMLIDKWCHGKLSAHALVSEARANVATNRGTVDELLLRLVNLNVHNAHRDLVQMLSRRHQEMVPPLFWHAHPGSHLGSHMLEPTVLHCRSVPFSGSHGRGVQGSLATESSWQALAFTRCCAAVPRGLALVVLRLPGRYTCFDCSLLPVPGQHGS